MGKQTDPKRPNGHKTKLVKTQKTYQTDELVRAMLESIPYGANFWNKDLELVDINAACVELLKLKNKKDFLEHFAAFSPEFQPDGRPSDISAAAHIRAAFCHGGERFEWTHRASDGEDIPCEINMVRVDFKGEDFVAAYVRDLREQKRMTENIEKQARQLNVVNRLAEVLLTSAGKDDFGETIARGLELVGRAMDADCVQIWPNETIDGRLNYVLGFKWLSENGEKAPPVPIGTAVPYNERWKRLFLNGLFINSPVSRLPEEDREILEPFGLTSTVTIPLFLHDKFWGVFCVDDCVKERYFTEGEVGILNSAGLMLASAVNRNAQSSQIKAAQSTISAMFNANPHMNVLFDSAFKIVDCNPAALEFFGYKTKEELLAGFVERMLTSIPAFQPDGRASIPLPERLVAAVKEGFVRFDTELVINGVKKNLDVEFKRIPYGDSFAVVGYVYDMTGVRERELELKAMEEAARSANKAKSAFLSTMSHEIRTPMNAILGITEILLHNETLAPGAREGLEKIRGSGDMLLGIINDILDLSKIEAGKLELADFTYETASFISDTAQLNMMRIGSKPIEFELVIDENLPAALSGDELRVKQILNNILSNASKYTASGKVQMSVDFKPAASNGKIVLIVKITDTGPCMTE